MEDNCGYKNGIDRINALSKYLAIAGTVNRSSYVYLQSFSNIISGYFLYYVIFGIVNAEGVVIVELFLDFSTTNSFEFNSSGVNPVSLSLLLVLSIAVLLFSYGGITIIGGLCIRYN